MITVIPCLGYADILAITLPAWRLILPGIIRVVTTPDDYETVITANVNNCEVITTDRWYADNAKLNKAAALDVGFGFHSTEIAPPQNHEVCLALDADIYPVGEFPFNYQYNTQFIQPETLYSIYRYECLNQETLEKHLLGEVPLRQLKQIILQGRRRGPKIGLSGYFQLWREDTPYTFGSFPTAAKYDVNFALNFSNRMLLPGNLYGLHLGEQKKNWSGRVTPAWKQ